MSSLHDMMDHFQIRANDTDGRLIRNQVQYAGGDKRNSPTEFKASPDFVE